MDEPGEYVLQPGDMVLFDRPPDGNSRQRLFRVASHDADTGLTTFDGFTEPLSAQQLAGLGARKVRVIAPGDFKPNWERAARALAAEGAGSRSKIQLVYQAHFSDPNHVLRSADDQAALALAQQAADDIGEPIILARVRSGELLVGAEGAYQAVAEAYGAQTILVVQPASLSSSGWLTRRQARERISGQRAHDVISAALTRMAELPDTARDLIVNEAIRSLTGLFSSDEDPNVSLPPGLRYHEELMPEIAEILARIRSEEDTGAA